MYIYIIIEHISIVKIELTHIYIVECISIVKMGINSLI